MVLVLCVSLCVCLSITTLSATSVVSTLKMRYVEVYLRRLFLAFEFVDFSSVQKFWREKANMQMSSMYLSRLVLASIDT